MAETIQLNVEGMSCGHCVKAIETGVSELAGVDAISVNLQESTVDVAYDNTKLDKTDISRAIEEAGYAVKGLVDPS
ncbi:copper ion binding protein [Viridibacillus sp. FSL R5-0477]|uniref:Copper chaperone CopZ n=1 Tax=Viridibacillus arenosi FSL R5-213 TaxID=1227360 RepID=W4ES45_9BACL|nr:MULTISPECIES: copper ion binding protein [Viridibacillus]ETT82852.1 Copper chaperone CopZ [Viridibacillus arenosi FSL R5-213]OMC82198.1 copper resistance protein CopZ [Viridibacillus sp. FSL H8-0123]OMC86355.1 copper resistance protein CopZ [Viridibacillus sp. FSL H7-0596]OMC90741.1 copper resistance protein CopZ [Viridibacillus arenosi]